MMNDIEACNVVVIQYFSDTNCQSLIEEEQLYIYTQCIPAPTGTSGAASIVGQCSVGTTIPVGFDASIVRLTKYCLS